MDDPRQDDIDHMKMLASNVMDALEACQRAMTVMVDILGSLPNPPKRDRKPYVLTAEDRQIRSQRLKRLHAERRLVHNAIQGNVPEPGV